VLTTGSVRVRVVGMRIIEEQLGISALAARRGRTPGVGCEDAHVRLVADVGCEGF
jgi:hypothetical protein